MRVLLVDDHPLFRQALATTIRHVADELQVEQHETLASARAALEADSNASLVLLDLMLPDSEGISGLLSLKAHFPQLPIAVVSAIDDEETVQTAIACGASGFISKGCGVPELTEAIETLFGGEIWFPESSGGSSQGVLTATQARILDAVNRGLMNKQIAYELNLSEATIKYHLTGLFRKFGVQTRSQLVGLSRQRVPPF